VQGDTTTAMVAALSGFYKKIPIGHIEAGLRTQDRYNPFPEEINRRMITELATYHFAPTKLAKATLLKEGIPKNNVFLTGNTVVDALNMIIKNKICGKLTFSIADNKKIILVTAHRRENFGQPLINICNALKEIARRNPEVQIIYPVHLNPNVKKPVLKILNSSDRIHLIDPLEYSQLVNLMSRSYIVLTDSGGIQEEAPAFGIPVLVMRKETERPEGIKAKVAKLVGTDKNNIIKQVELLLNKRSEYAKMSKAVSPYGDGKAAKRIFGIVASEAKRGFGK
jgi:UDP-N-acetylglucosamine 2-epimerase (non-hydrolysing)